jgi:hypothetical protein
MEAGHADVTYTLIEAVVMRLLCGSALGAVVWACLLLGSEARADIVYSGDINIEVRFDIDELDGSKNQPIALTFSGFASGGFQIERSLVFAGLDVQIRPVNTTGSFLGIDPNEASAAERLRLFAANADLIDLSATWNANASILHGASQFGSFPKEERGPFKAPGTVGYLGVQFESVNATTHFGWIRYESLETSTTLIRGQVTGWAYNSVAGGGIQAAAVPEPAGGLLLLSAVSAGVGFRRRRA